MLGAHVTDGYVGAFVQVQFIHCVVLDQQEPAVQLLCVLHVPLERNQYVSRGLTAQSCWSASLTKCMLG